MKPRYTVYKSDISYFSGKLEAYLRYKGIAYEAIECGRDELEENARCENGQWSVVVRYHPYAGMA